MRRMRTGLCKLLVIAVVLIAAPVQAFAAQTVVVDAGHGGSDPGAVGVNGLYEKYVNLDIAFKLQQQLLKLGYDVVLTRDSDKYISLADRVALTAAAKPSLFVSVHANWHTDSKVDGSLVLYYDKDYPQASYPASEAMTALSPESKRLAALVQQGMVAEAGFADKGLVPSAAYVIRMGQVPSILVETAFLSNKSDAARLADETVRLKLAKGIATGIAAYLPLSVPGGFSDIAGHWAREAIIRLQRQGLVEGSDGRYDPDKPMTRAEWLTIADRLFRFDNLLEAGSGGQSSVAKAVYGGVEPAFNDLTEKHWAYETFRKAIRLGYISGYEDGTARPDRAVTRSEVAALLERMTVGPNPSPWTKNADFTDVPLTYWASGPIYRMKEKGLLEGIGANTFAPAKSMTRGEMAAMIDRYVTASAAAAEKAKAGGNRPAEANAADRAK